MKNVQVTHNDNLLSRTKQHIMLKFGTGSLHKKKSGDHNFFSYYLTVVLFYMNLPSDMISFINNSTLHNKLVDDVSFISITYIQNLFI